VTSFSLGSNDLVRSVSLLPTVDSTSGAWKVTANGEVVLKPLGLSLPRLSPWLVVWQSLELQATLLVIGQTGCISSQFSDFHALFSLLPLFSGCDLAKLTFSYTGLCIGLRFGHWHSISPSVEVGALHSWQLLLHTGAQPRVIFYLLDWQESVHHNVCHSRRGIGTGS